MKAFIIAAMLGVAASAGADCAYAEYDGDTTERPRDGSTYQAEVFRAPRVPADASMTIKGATSTTNFGFYPFVDLAPRLETDVVSTP